MQKEILYKYMGTNGIILSPIHLEDIYYIRQLRLKADNNKKLTKDGIQTFSTVLIPEEELTDWYEIDDDGQE